MLSPKLYIQNSVNLKKVKLFAVKKPMTKLGVNPGVSFKYKYCGRAMHAAIMSNKKQFFLTDENEIAKHKITIIVIRSTARCKKKVSPRTIPRII